MACQPGVRFEHYLEATVVPTERLIVCVKAVIRDQQGQCLLLRRSRNCRTDCGKWDLPGGKANPGESLLEALRREVAEETGLTISVDGVAAITWSRGPEARVLCVVFDARVGSGELNLSDEHDRYTWERGPATVLTASSP